jgi:hypothetical protein
MATTALHTVWDCRWSRVHSPLSASADRWLCAHEGAPRPVGEEECRTCPNWEYGHRPAADDHLAMPKPSMPGRRGLLQGLILLNAVVLIVCGLVPLTTPLYVPFAAGMWLVAAGLIGFAFFGPIPRGSEAAGTSQRGHP